MVGIVTEHSGLGRVARVNAAELVQRKTDTKNLERSRRGLKKTLATEKA